MKTEKRKVGDLGEEIACKFLEKHGFRIVTKNYLRKWGEIDIIAEKEKVLHFIEVKSKSVETFFEESDDYRPEEQVHKWKVERLHRAIASYLMENKFEEREYQLDIVVVLINFKDRKTRVRYLPTAI